VRKESADEADKEADEKPTVDDHVVGPDAPGSIVHPSLANLSPQKTEFRREGQPTTNDRDRLESAWQNWFDACEVEKQERLEKKKQEKAEKERQRCSTARPRWMTRLRTLAGFRRN